LRLCGRQAATAVRSSGFPRRFALPETLTPSSVLGLPREIKAHDGLPTPKVTELSRSIDLLERHYFSDRNGDSDPDLGRIAETWISQAS